MKLDIKITNLRERSTPSLTGEFVKFASKGLHDFTKVAAADGYKWYQLEDGNWVAGVSGAVEEKEGWEKPIPVDQDITVNQVYVGDVSLRIRDAASTNGVQMGVCIPESYYNVFDTKVSSGYTWYMIGEKAWIAGVDEVKYVKAHTWIAPSPVEEDENKDQIFVGNVLLNIRSLPSSDGEKMGQCVPNSFYDVLATKDNGYTWYSLGAESWVAGVEEVEYYPVGSSKKDKEILDHIDTLTANLEVAKKAVQLGESTEYYDELDQKVLDLNSLIDKFDTFEYDYVDKNSYDEIDILYTADVHGAWVGYDTNGNYLTPIFSYKDVGNYRNKLEQNGIKTLIVDCGDWSRPCKAYDDYIASGASPAAREMKNQNYFLETFGNHEWRWCLNEGMSTEKVLDLCDNMTACNLFKNGKLLYKPYRTAKIGDKRLAVIGIGYPSANGKESYNNGTWTYSFNGATYTFLDDGKLYTQVQKYIDELKAAKFDYIVVATHMCKSTYESDERYIARTDSLITHTSGLTAVLQGHYNMATNAETIRDRKGNGVLLAHEAGANMNSFGRLRLKNKGTVSSYLLDEQSDLKVV